MRKNLSVFKTAFRPVNDRSAEIRLPSRHGRRRAKIKEENTMRINTNITAMNTYTQYTNNNNKIAGAVEKLSSGYAINSAADNAAGLAISEKMRAQIRGLEKASTNSQDAISLVQTAEGALGESEQILQRMRELAVQSASDTNEDTIDRAALQDEFEQLQQELDEIAKNTTFNKKNLLDGSLSTTKLTSGSNTVLQGSSMSVSLGKAAAGSYSFGVSVVTTEDAIAAHAADTLQVNSSTVNNTYFSGADLTASSLSTQASSLLNGNYSISVGSVNTDNNTFTLVATGDNGLSFTSSAINMNDDYSSGTGTPTVVADFGDAAFSIDFDLQGTYAQDYTLAADQMGDEAITNFANAFKDTTFTVSGGVDAKDAVKEVQASLTGGSNVTLKAGMTSATFDNGITVNFDKLTAADLDTNLHVGTTAATVGVGNDYTAASDYGITQTTSGDGAGTESVLTLDLTGMSSDYTGQMSFTLLGGTYDIDVTDADTANTIAGKLRTVLAADMTTYTNANGASADVSYAATGVGGAGAQITFTATSDVDTDPTLEAITDASVSGLLAEYNYQDIYGDTASTVQVQSLENEGLTFQVGANEGDELSINISEMNAKYLGVNGATVGSRTDAADAIANVDSAINQVSSQRAYLGSIQNRLEHKIANLETTAENLTSAESQIRDVDMAKEMTNFTSANILQQAATAMLAQANSLPQNVLSLIGG
jgi:flagellin